MIKLFSNGVYLINNKDIVEDCNEINLILKNKLGNDYPSKENAKKNMDRICRRDRYPGIKKNNKRWAGLRQINEIPSQYFKRT